MKRLRTLLNCLILPVIFAAPAFSQPPQERGAFLSLYRELVETNTAFSSGDCTRAARLLETRFRAAGFTDSELTQYVPPDRPRDGGLVVIWSGRNPSIPAMLLLAHIDVVEAKREDWVRDPFKLIEEDGYFYGRGTTDDKAQAAIFVDTLIRLRQAKFQPKRTLKLALTCGEETSNPDVLNGAGWLVDNRPDLLKAAFALNEGGSGRGGPSGMPSYLGLGVGEKSPRNFAIEATNPGGHSSTPVRDNAIYQLAEGLVRLRDLQFPVRLNTPPPLDPKIVGPMEKIAAKHFPGVPIIPDMSTGASDATHLGRIGIPTYGVPGLWNEPETAGTHGLNERISANALYRGRDYLFELIKYFSASS